MQFRVVNNSKFFNALTSVRRIVFFFKILDRSRDSYITSQPRWCIHITGWFYKLMQLAPRFHFRERKIEFQIE